ncbi:hypothetical protein ACFFJX_20915 [Pseudarcicella hirudinis]|uniref:hypothetical protein n=1 Tax=Pseudarcicella hirudinis TaxID=1079859 RepID=UPI0035E6AAC3
MVANLAAANAGQAPLDGWDATKNPNDQITRTDWIGAIFRTGIVQRHNISINAGTEKFSTLFQGRYERNEGTLLNTYSENISLRFNTSYKFTDRLKFRQELFWNNHGAVGTSTESGYSGTILSAIYMPRAATVYYPDGSFGGVGPRDSPYLGIHGDAINPVATLLRNNPNDKSNDLQSVSELSFSNIIPGLSFLTRFLIVRQVLSTKISNLQEQNPENRTTRIHYHIVPIKAITGSGKIQPITLNPSINTASEQCFL